jgi:uncharacterized SAM-binding protein YcdF (DUF218 family)
MKRLKVSVGVFLILALIYFMTMHILISSEIENTPVDNADYAIVLGARLYGDMPSPSLVLRLDKAVEYLRANPHTMVIVSGGQGKDESITEAEAMRRYLEKKGVLSERIIIEDKSTNTKENLEFSIEKARKNGASEESSFLIISSKYHIYRSKLLAKRIGFEADVLPSEVPSSVKAASWIREYFALGKSMVFDW